MSTKKAFELVHKNINKCETRHENYLIPSSCSSDKIKIENPTCNYKTNHDVKIDTKNSKIKLSDEQQQSENETFQTYENNGRKATIESYATFSEQKRNEQPKICIWKYMQQSHIEHLLTLTNKQEIRKTIDDTMKTDYPKGICRLLTIEMMYSLIQFCRQSKFNIKQVGALLSMFYLTHQYFLGSYYTTAENTYRFFKEHMLLHCFESPPDSMQLFDYSESTHVVEYFCALYLRNLPLIRLLTLPNFGFYLHYEKPPDTFEDKKQKDKGKGKGNKGK